MYAHFEGVVAEKNTDSIVLDVGGVGYLLYVSGATLSMAPFSPVSALRSCLSPPLP